MVVAIDGPSGAGKSSIAQAVAENISYGYLDTGALYRAIAAVILEKGGDLDDIDIVEKILPQISVNLSYEGSQQKTFVNGEDYSSKIRSSEVSMGASRVAGYPVVREKLLAIQRDTGEKQDIIVDGRDIGTVVFPNAPVKIYLTASPESRAKRRILQNADNGITDSYEKVLTEILQRDEQDKNRPIAPLRQAEDAVLVDTTNCTLEESIEWVKKIIKSQLD